MTRDTAYLDWNATTPPSEAVLGEMERARAIGWANPSSIHADGRAARAILESARETIAKELGLHPKDLLFTGSATEANHLALSGATSIVTSRLEHPSVARQAEHLGSLGRPLEWARVTSAGLVDIDSIHECFMKLRTEGRLGGRPLLALMAVSHETGVLQPIRESREVADAFQADLHVDAVQLLGRGDLGVLRLADSFSLAGHKIRGPKGIGALAVRCGRSPRPLGYGGAQERGLRPGTQDASLAAGFAVAVRSLEDLRAGFQACDPFRTELEAWVAAHGGTVHGTGTRLPHVSNFRLPGWKGDELVAALDLAGVSVSAGSACSAGTAELSSAILAMSNREAAEGAIRVSMGPGVGARELGRLVAALGRLLVRRD